VKKAGLLTAQVCLTPVAIAFGVVSGFMAFFVFLVMPLVDLWTDFDEFIGRRH
jgi:hypothetical protein